jgi:hypothetical protein
MVRNLSPRESLRDECAAARWRVTSWPNRAGRIRRLVHEVKPVVARSAKRLRLPVVAFFAALTMLVLAPASGLAQFQLGFEDPGFSDPVGSTPSQIAFGALNAVHGSTVRLYVGWGGVAPGGSTEPAGFDPSNPGDPRYTWTAVDTAVRSLTQRHDHVVIDLTGPPAPAWATPPGEPASLHVFTGSWNPNAKQFGLFARAAALRYSGHFADPLNPGSALPAVRGWEIWNEENLPLGLMAPNLVSEYRALLNAGYGAIKGVSNDNVVAMGGLAPVSYESVSISPLKFAAELLCLRRIATHFVRADRCPSKAHLDVLAMHPYSLLATPTKHAYRYDDVLVGDMGKLVTLLRAAEHLHTAAPAINYGLWVTEFSWFTNPPDPQVGDPGPVAARYSAYSMYEMWRAGVSLVIWYTTRDPENAAAHANGFAYGGGLYNASGTPKLTLTAFRFPVVAGVSGGHGFVWGRAPASGRPHVIVEQAVGRGWKRIGTVRTSSDGVFELHFAAGRNAVYRARIPHGAISLGYDSRPIPAARTHTS